MAAFTSQRGANTAGVSTTPTLFQKFQATDLYHPLFAFLITRLVVFLGGYIGEIAIPSIDKEGYYHVAPDNLFVDIWSRWDSSFYISIVEQGYSYVPDQISNVAFFPLYPLLTRIVSIFTPTVYSAGLIVSHLCFLAALIFLYKLTAHEFDKAAASRTVYYIAAFPTAFFFSAFYTESTYLLMSVAAVYFARRKRWVWAALFAMLTTVSRVVGLGIWGVVGLEWLNAQGWSLSTLFHRSAWQNLAQGMRRNWSELLVICLVPLGLINHMLFLSRTVQDPLAFWSVQSAWGREDLGPIKIILRDIVLLFSQNFGTGDIWWHVIFDVGALAFVLLMAIAIWRNLGEGMAIYCVIAMLLPANSGSVSLMRYVLILFPVFMMLGRWGRRHTLDRALTIGFTMFLGIFTTIFVNWIFVA